MARRRRRELKKLLEEEVSDNYLLIVAGSDYQHVPFWPSQADRVKEQIQAALLDASYSPFPLSPQPTAP